MRWTLREDARLRAIMVQHGTAVRWKRVADTMRTRNVKQCRERWMQHLRPMLSQTEWTQDEDMQIICGVHWYGHRWSTIAQTIKGRSDTNVKNRAHRLKLVTQNRAAWAAKATPRHRVSNEPPDAMSHGKPSDASCATRASWRTVDGVVNLLCYEKPDLTWWEEPTLPQIPAPGENLPNLFFFDENGLITVSD